MEVHILDSLLRRTAVVDVFESLIWTERFREIGDFELTLESTLANRRLFTAGKKLVHKDSVRVMTVESVEDIVDENDDIRKLKVKGRSIETVLEDRPAVKLATFAADGAKWKVTGTPASIARQMFNYICVAGTNSANDVIPFLGSPALFPADTIPENATVFDLYQEPDTLLNAIQGLCEAYDLGYRLIRNHATNQLRFDIYPGNDRTKTQTTLPPVVFSENFDNLLSATEFTNAQGAKNCAFVYTEGEDAEEFHYEIVYADDIDPTVAGFERKMLYLNVSLEEDELSDIPGSLQLYGKIEIAKSRTFTAYDGEVVQDSDYVYGLHYFLGDLVTLENPDGDLSDMRVTEQIFVCDEQGDRSYPTLSIRKTAEVGTWGAQGALTWADMDTEVWADMT